ncbi:thioredoxin domain-containing protein [Acetatifactor aquisgranensis]|nr:hypothetical protein [Acetatifactor aquisgranensis]
MQFIQYQKCSTCKKAADWLKSHQIPYEDSHARQFRLLSWHGAIYTA